MVKSREQSPVDIEVARARYRPWLFFQMYPLISKRIESDEGLMTLKHVYFQQNRNSKIEYEGNNESIYLPNHGMIATRKPEVEGFEKSMKFADVTQRVPARESGSPAWLKCSQQVSREPHVLSGNGGSELGETRTQAA